MASTNLSAKVVVGFSAIHSGFWLGLLDNHHLDEATIAFYTANAQFLDADHNLRGLAPWEARVIDRHTTPGTRVLVPAAGGGREILALQDMGYDATGYDPVAPLVDVGNRIIARTGSDAMLLLSHANQLPDGLGPPYDWALFGWGSVSHIQGRDARIQSFSDIYRALNPGGIFIVSFLAREARSPRYNVVYKVARTIRDLRRSRDRLEVGDTIDGSFDHHFTFSEISGELEAAGFTEVEQIEQPYPHVVYRRS